MAFETLSNGQQYELSTTMDRSWQRAEELRQTPRQALWNMMSKNGWPEHRGADHDDRLRTVFTKKVSQ